MVNAGLITDDLFVLVSWRFSKSTGFRLFWANSALGRAGPVGNFDGVVIGAVQ
jgi:hypothetical protein